MAQSVLGTCYQEEISPRLLEVDAVKTKHKASLFEIEGSVNMDTFSGYFTPEIRKTIDAVRKYGFDVRVVGGAVRDFLIGRVPRDVDFATDADPAELIFIFDLEGIDHDDGGIQHGTIKSVFGNQKVDVTSIKHRLRLQGNRIEIETLDSWEKDSASRDLTINSMSLDLEGNIYDYQGGLDDLRSQMVRFCPDPQKKIDQDPFTILRWFKGISMFESPRWLKKDRKVIEDNAVIISPLINDKRTPLLMDGLKSSKNWEKILRLMCNTGVAKGLDITCS